MQDLRDKLLKAGLVQKKQARQARTEARQKKKQQGATLEEQQLREQADRYAAKQSERREQTREAQQALNQQREAQAAQARLREIIRRHALRKVLGNDRPFFFAGPDGRIRRLTLTFQAAALLTEGKAAIVAVDDDPLRDYALVEAEAAHKLEQLAPQLLLFWNKPGAGADEQPTDSGADDPAG